MDPLPFLEPELPSGVVVRLVARGQRREPELGFENSSHCNDRVVWEWIAREAVAVNQTVRIGSRWRRIYLRLDWRNYLFGV